MLVWEFGEDLSLASIEDVHIEGEDRFLDEIYFFLVDNNMDSVLQERYRVNWE